MRKYWLFRSLLLSLSISVMAVNPPNASGQTGEPGQGSSAVEEANQWTIGIASGSITGTFPRFAAELAGALNEEGKLRILPVITDGATSNVADLLYLKGIDVAITHADVFEEYKKFKKTEDIDKQVNYISQLYVTEVNLYVRPEIKTLQDLEGKTVSLHLKGSGQATTGPIVFGRLGIKPNFVFVHNDAAVKKMEEGEIDAIFHNGGKPNPFILDLKPKPGFRLLSIPFGEEFAEYYVPSSLEHTDYPALIPEGERVETLGIPVVLAIYNWSEGSPRFPRIERFIEYYYQHFDRLKEPSYHPKWKAINLAATVPGWTRYPLAQRIVDNLIKEAAPVSDPDTRAVAAAELARTLGIETEDQQVLFQEFLEWRSTRKQ
jgi:TRAP transporter TAXI family solute receptor